MPSRSRRVVVICAYLLLMFMVHTIIIVGALSPRCINNNYCSASERVVSLAAGITLLAMAALIIALGWKGRLVGARRTS
jgi:small neutral amino acid transporter SnatA (MarC family)